MSANLQLMTFRFQNIKTNGTLSGIVHFLSVYGSAVHQVISQLSNSFLTFDNAFFGTVEFDCVTKEIDIDIVDLAFFIELVQSDSISLD